MYATPPCCSSSGRTRTTTCIQKTQIAGGVSLTFARGSLGNATVRAIHGSVVNNRLRGTHRPASLRRLCFCCGDHNVQ
jgi:hypothetical protein